MTKWEKVCENLGVDPVNVEPSSLLILGPSGYIGRVETTCQRCGLEVEGQLNRCARCGGDWQLPAREPRPPLLSRRDDMSAALRTTRQRRLAPRADAARARLRERQQRHDELLADIEARQRAKVAACEREDELVRGVVYGQMYALYRARGYKPALAR